MAELEEQTNGIEVETTTAATEVASESHDNQTTPPVDDNYNTLKEKNQALEQQLAEVSKVLAELKDHTGFGEGDEPEPEPDTANPELAQLSAQVEGYKEVMQAHVDASLEDLPKEQQTLIRELGGEDPLAQFRALSRLQKAGMLATKNPKPKNQRGSHQGRVDSGTAQGRPATLNEIRAEARKDLLNL